MKNNDSLVSQRSASKERFALLVDREAAERENKAIRLPALTIELVSPEGERNLLNR
jgi:hypothetical protein